jgi:hypothetical protein
LLGKAPDELAKSLIWVQVVAYEVSGIPRAHVCALEVPYKDPYQVGPITNSPWWEMFQPSSHRVSQERGKLANDEQVTIHAAQLTS